MDQKAVKDLKYYIELTATASDF